MLLPLSAISLAIFSFLFETITFNAVLFSFYAAVVVFFLNTDFFLTVISKVVVSDVFINTVTIC